MLFFMVNSNPCSFMATVFCIINHLANVAELVDALDLGSSGATRESSSLSFRTRFIVI